jgi:alpha-beta hydrolase superfamily lysophospholipase
VSNILRFVEVKKAAFTFIVGLSLFSLILPFAHAQGVIIDTVARRNIVIDLGEGLTTDAQLTFPALGRGPYPGVLLVHGSGNTDMDEYLPPIATGTDKPARLFLQVAEYLSERGFAVLRYNKRGIGLNGTILNSTIVGNWTIQVLIEDSKRALDVLRRQPEVDSSDITMIGHSEGTWIVPRVAAGDPKIMNIVLMSAGAQNLREILYFQLIDRSVSYAQDTLDINHDGLLSLYEVESTLEVKNILLSPLAPQGLIQNESGRYDWYPGLDTNNDGYMNIQKELKPLLISQFNALTSSDPKSPYFNLWLQSHLALKDTNLALIGNVTASILILQGEGDTQLPVEQAFLLEQRLTEAGHPDHTLITYPSLGHSFYPVEGWIQPLGPIQEKVLGDLFAWLQSPTRNVQYLKAQLRTTNDTIANLQSQLNNQTRLFTEQLQAARNETQAIRTRLAGDLDTANSRINDLERRNTELQTALNTSTTLTYIAITIATIAVIIGLSQVVKRRTSISLS